MLNIIGNFIRNKLRCFLKIEDKKPKKLAGISYLSHKYNDPTGPREEDIAVPSSVFVVYNNEIKEAVLMRVPKVIKGEPALGLVGLINPTLQTFIPLYRIGKTRLEAQQILDRINEI